MSTLLVDHFVISKFVAGIFLTVCFLFNSFYRSSKLLVGPSVVVVFTPIEPLTVHHMV